MSLFTHKRTYLILGGLIVIGGIAFTVNAQSKPTKTAVAQTLNLSESTTLTTLDTSKITDGVSSAQLSQVDEGLYRLDQNSQPVNALATKTKITNGGKTYTIDLHHDGRWSNGQAVTAQDFVYAWQRAVTPQTKSEFAYRFTNLKNASAIIAGKKSPQTLGIQAPGKYRLKLTLSKPAAYFKKSLASTIFYPLNRTAVQKYGAKYGTTAKTTVFNGPFILTGWTGTNDHWTLKRNPTYRANSVVKLHQINYHVLKSGTTAYNLYQAHKLDMVTLSGEQNVQNQHNTALKTLPSGRIGFIQYNQHDRVAANHALRQAISLAINRQQLATKVLANGSIAAKSFGVHGMLTNPSTGADFIDDATVKHTTSYQLKAAQKAYRTAQKQLHHSQLTLTITCGDDDTSHQVAEFIQGQLTSHLNGLHVTIKAMPFTAMLGKVSHGDFQLNLTSWGMDFADPSQALTILTTKSDSNMGHYHSATYDQAMRAAEGVDAMQPQTRYHELVKAAKTALTDQAVTPLYEGRSHLLVNPQLKGVVYNHFSGDLNFRTAYLK